MMIRRFTDINSTITFATIRQLNATMVGMHTPALGVIESSWSLANIFALQVGDSDKSATNFGSRQIQADF